MRLALLVGLHAVVWALVLWATSPEGDCTKSGTSNPACRSVLIHREHETDDDRTQS